MADDTISTSLTITCQCLAVQIPAPASEPSAIYHCHCIECRRQSASAFGTSAVFPAKPPLFPLHPDLSAKLSVYCRSTERDGTMACYFCTRCGSRLFHHASDCHGTPLSLIWVKGGCVDGLDWARGIHIFTRSAVVPIPTDAEQYETMPPPDDA